jgi:predicted acyltransferase
VHLSGKDHGGPVSPRRLKRLIVQISSSNLARVTTSSGDKSALRRADALDAFRGLAILGMILSGQLPFGEKALPGWMYHAQVPPPKHEWIGTLAGITWVDLVFPFFLFALGASIPLALVRRIEDGVAKWRIALFIAGRGALLGFFALYVEDIRPDVISKNPAAGTYWVGLLGFALLFPIFARLPAAWRPELRWGIRISGWVGAVCLLARLRYPDGSGFSLSRSDIIIVVLANVAFFGSLLWWATRNRLLLRLGVMGILIAVRLSNRPEPVPGWVNDIWRWSPAPWIYQLYYLQYLFIVIPGTVAGELLLEWMRGTSSGPAWGWSKARCGAIACVMFALPVVLVVGLKARWLVSTTAAAFVLCCFGWWLLSKPADAGGRFFQKLFGWAIYWLVLGLIFEPYEGGIKKDHPTLSYYFVTCGAAICLLIFPTILIDGFKVRRPVRLLIDNGQNPMIAYAGINNFVIPILALTGLERALSALETPPWLGFVRGVIITSLLAVSVSCFTRMKIFWRS